MRVRTALFFVVLITPVLGCRDGREPSADAPRIENVVVVGKPADWTGLRPMVTETRRLWCLESVSHGTRLRVVWGAPYVVQDVEIPSGNRLSADLDPGIVPMGCPRTSLNGAWINVVKQDHRGRPVIAFNPNDGTRLRYLALGTPLVWMHRGPGVLYAYDGTHLAIVFTNVAAVILPSLPVPVTAVSAATPHGNDAAIFSALYQENTGALLATYDEETRRMLSLRRTESAEFLLWHETRRRLQLQIKGAAPAWAEFENAKTLRRLGSLGDERITHAAFAAAGLVLATVTTAGEARIRIIPNDQQDLARVHP
jgi:hypothetical protein